jgi:hypothetical protein
MPAHTRNDRQVTLSWISQNPTHVVLGVEIDRDLLHLHRHSSRCSSPPRRPRRAATDGAVTTTTKNTPGGPERLAGLLSRLPAEARGDIEAVIDLYHRGGTMQFRAQFVDFRPTLDKMRQAADDLAADIENVGVHDLGMTFLVAGVPHADEARVASTLAALRELSSWLAIARVRLRPKRGPKTEVKRQFVASVAAVIELHTGKRTAVSYKAGSLAEMVREIVAAVDPDISPRTIDEVLKRLARRRRISEIKR